MTETNFGASRPVRLTGLGKTVLHREGERAKDGVRDAEEAGRENWTEMDYTL